MSDATRRGGWSRSWSWRVRRWQWHWYQSGSEKPSTGDPSRPCGESSGMRIRQTMSRHASSALGRRGREIPTVHTFDESPSSMGRHRRGTRRAWRRVFCSSSSGRDIDPQRCGAPCQSYTQYGSWGGYHRSDGNASGASPVRRWLPRETALTQAPMFCRSWPRPARLRRTGLSSPPPSSPSAASRAWGKSRLSGAPACGGRRWLSGASKGTRAGFPVTSAVLRASGPTGCGASSLDGTSWSTEPPSSKRVWPGCSKAALTLLTAGTRGVARGLPSSASVASPGATCAGGDAGPVCAWHTSMQRRRRTSPSTRVCTYHGQRVRGSSGSPPTRRSSGRHRSWVSAYRTRDPLSSRPPDRSATGVPRPWWKGTTPGTLCSRQPPSDPHDPHRLENLREEPGSRPPRVRRWLPRSPRRPQSAERFRPPRPETPLLEVRQERALPPTLPPPRQPPSPAHRSEPAVPPNASPSRRSSRDGPGTTSAPPPLCEEEAAGLDFFACGLEEEGSELLLNSRRGQQWLDRVSGGLRVPLVDRGLVRSRIRLLLMRGNVVARDLGVFDFLEAAVAALDRLEPGLWPVVFRESTSPKPILVGLSLDVLERGVGAVGNIRIPDFIWHAMAPNDILSVSTRALPGIRNISPEGLVMARALVRDGILTRCPSNLPPNGWMFPVPNLHRDSYSDSMGGRVVPHPPLPSFGWVGGPCYSL